MCAMQGTVYSWRFLLASGYRCLRVGTDCSGLEAPLLALDRMRIEVKHCFASEKDTLAKATLLANFKPRVFYNDLRRRSVRRVPRVDLYVAGFPCQSFSAQGARSGFADKHGRGTIFRYIYRYIRKRDPKVFVLENVPGLKHVDGGACFDAIWSALRDLRQYKVFYGCMNAEQVGIPQHRPRLFFIGILKKHYRGGFKFPNPRMERMPLEHFLLPRRRSPSLENLPDSCTSRSNVLAALERLRVSGEDPFRQPWVINCDSAPDRSHMMFNRVPCLTHSRTQGHWLTNRGRYLHVVEAMRLQGFPLDYIVPEEISSRQFFAMLGNSMCIDVLVAILECVLPAAGLPRKS
jgi:DNA (cytosine-5)-methyltransferase 1